MKTFTGTFAVASLMIMCVCSCKGPQLGKSSIEDVVAAMTLEEKVHLIVGVEMLNTQAADGATVGTSAIRVPGAAGATFEIERLGIPSIVLSDGPAGLRINPTREGDEATYYCTHFPIGTLLSSTWNQELIENVGSSIGNEVLEYGADVLLAPAMNIHRHPLNGRNFEYYSEDPVLTGKTAAAYVRGVQSAGVGTSIKHFAFNNQETNRMGDDARISERAQREIYLKGFEIAVKEGKPLTVMTSYNKINGTYTSESRELIQGILRDEWKFDGSVMSDWYGGDNAPAQMVAGNDMLQPGTQDQYESIINAVKDGSLPMETIDINVARILRTIKLTPAFRGYKYSNHPDLEAHAQVTRQSATEGMVLLENNGILPLSSEIKNIAVFGNTSFNFIAGGTGSGNVNRAYTVSLIDGLKNGGYNVDESMSDAIMAQISSFHEEYVKSLPSLGTYAPFLPEPVAPEILPNDDLLGGMVAGNDVAIITFGRISGEFVDRSSADFALSKEEKSLLDKVCGAFHSAGKKVIVILNIGGVIETASWKNKPDAVLLAWQAGQEGGNSVTDILSGKQSPSGRLPMTWPVNLMDAGASRNFPIDITAGIDITNKNTNENRKDVDYTIYEEGIYVGYRWFDKNDLEVSYPFGYGLSYTDFDFSNASATVVDGKVNISVDVTNTGSAASKEVVQVYVCAPESSLDKPAKELKAYAKTSQLNPGEKEAVEISFAASDLASFDENKGEWVLDKGTYKILLGASSRDIRCESTIEISTEL